MALDAQEEEIVEKVFAILGEHFGSFVFIVTPDEKDALYYDWSNAVTAEGLLARCLRDVRGMTTEDEEWEIEWDEDEDDDGEGWKHSEVD